MKLAYLILTHLIFLALFCEIFAKIRDTSQAFTTRQKRFLIYPEGVNWVQILVGVGFPVELRRESVTWGVTMNTYYLVPTNSSEVLQPSIDVERRKRSLSRWEIYSAIRTFIDRLSFGNGKSCLMRAICEATLAPFEEKTGLLAEILHVLLTPSTTKEEVQDYTDFEYHAAENLGKYVNDCARLFSGCDLYFFEKLSKILI